MTPTLFVSHGSPMNAIEQNAYTRDLNSIGRSFKNIEAILVISAHWETNGVYITDSEILPTYHDFRGFPKELFAVEYPAKAALSLIPEIEKLIAEPIKRESKRGLDHGAWSMLLHLFPEANIPVLQLSLDTNKTVEQHFELAQKLSPLRKKNILILMSGNITHNFSHLNFENENAKPFDWAVQFDEAIQKAFLTDDKNLLFNLKNNKELFKINHPTDDHFLPLLYLMGLKTKEDNVTFPHMSWQYGTLSMRHILLN